ALESIGGVSRAGPADRETIRREFLERLPEARGDLLWVFWGGHGQLGEEERYLLFANASERDFATLDAHSLTRALQDRGYSGLSRQVFIIDACANPEGRHRPSHRPDTFPFPDRRQLPQQFVWMGSRAGEVAKNDPLRRTGLFSDAVLSALKLAKDEPFPPDLSRLATEIGEEFKQRHQAGGFRQTPVTYRFTNWGGDEVEFDLRQRSPSLAPAGWSQPRLLALLEAVWPRLHHRVFLALGRALPPEYEVVQDYLASLLPLGDGDHPSTYEPLTGVSKVPESPTEPGRASASLAPNVHEQVRQKLRVLSDVTQGGDGMT
ncbi:caspase family protein, partial [Singulisphaera rosea]